MSAQQIACGRLVCDTNISSKELIRARSYDLTSKDYGEEKRGGVKREWRKEDNRGGVGREWSRGEVLGYNHSPLYFGLGYNDGGV